METKNDCGPRPDFKMDDETMHTILLKIMPPVVREGHERAARVREARDDCFSFKQASFVEINTRNMDEEPRERSGRINVLNNSSGEDDKVKRNADCIGYEEVETWSEVWQCNICGSVQKRSSGGSRSRGEDDEQDRPTTTAPRDQEATKGDKGKGRGKRPGGPCWMCGGPHFQRECPNLAKVGRRIPSPRRERRGDHEVFQDRLPSHTKEERATKEKERANCLDLVSIHFGDR